MECLIKWELMAVEELNQKQVLSLIKFPKKGLYWLFFM